jgi:hypothetical protein
VLSSPESDDLQRSVLSILDSDEDVSNGQEAIVLALLLVATELHEVVRAINTFPAPPP